MATEITILAVRSYTATTADDERTRHHWLLNAALVRGITALLSVDDPLMPRLRTGQPIPWDFGGQTLTIEMAAESSKIDLNTGEIGLLSHVLTQVLGEPDGRTALAVVLKARQRGDVFTEPEQVLPITRRFGQSAAKLRNVLTVLTGQRGVRLDSAHPLLVEALGSDIRSGSGGVSAVATAEARGASAAASERPIYTIAASSLGPYAKHRSQITVMLDPTMRSFVVVDRRSSSVTSP